MLFNSLDFMVFLIVVFLSIFIIREKKYQYLFLLFASYFFYFYTSKSYVLLFFVSSMANFFFGNYIFRSRKHRKAILVSAVLFNIALLGFFKYTNFAIIIVNDISSLFGNALNFSLLKIILPLGISFYTFEAISYVVDVYHRKVRPEKSLLNFLLFLAFFPKLIAGPIMRASEFFPQLKRKRIILTAENLKIGVTIIAWGIFKKIVIADNMAFFVNAVFSDPTRFQSSLPIILGAFGFGIQVYADFSGYVDIAIGAAKLFGFDLTPNFNRPYLSKTPGEFWRRWHMSLSYWIRDYIYTPLYVFFSKKKSLQKIKNINVRTKIIIYLANIVALFFMGIWHGAYWNFVIFGIYCGLLLVAYYVIADVRRQLKIKAKLTKFTSLLSVLITFYVMMFGFMMFRITNLHNLFFSLRRYLSFSFAGIAEDMTTLSQITSQHPGIFVAAILSIVIYALYFFSSNFNPKERLKDAKLIYWLAALAIMTLVIIVLLPTASGVFIYFQF